MEQCYRFITPCPASHHISLPNEKINWIHTSNDCGAEMYVTKEAHLKCSNGHSHRMVDWKFKCSDHDYKAASAQGYIYALFVLAQTGTPQDWIRETNANLLKQF